MGAGAGPPAHRRPSFQERVRKKRFDALERQRRMERLQRIKEDRRIRRDMLRVTLESRSGAVGSPFFGGSREDDVRSLAGVSASPSPCTHPRSRPVPQVASFGPEDDDFDHFAGEAGANESRAWTQEAGRASGGDGEG